MRYLYLISVLFCLFVSPALAAGEPETKLKDIVVTATRTEKSLEAVPGGYGRGEGKGI